MTLRIYVITKLQQKGRQVKRDAHFVNNYYVFVEKLRIKTEIMSQSLSKLYIHIIFHTKYNHNLIKTDVENELYAYLGGILKQNKCIPIAIKGTENHVHILCIQSKNIALADLLEELKRNSSRWIKTKGTGFNYFAWQGGYGGFSVSQSKVEAVKLYIENQKEHHKTETFKEEYIRFLREYGIDYNEEYIWT